MRGDLQRMFHVRIDNFRRENRISVAIQLANQRIEMGAYKLKIENPVPSGLTFLLMGPAQMRPYNNTTITVGQFVNFFKRGVKKPANACVIGNSVIPFFGCN